MVDPSGEAFWVARGWRDKKNNIWTDGSRLEDRRMGAAAIWWQEGGVEPPLVGPNTGRRYTPGCRDVGWTGKRYRLGRNKEVFDAELYAFTKQPRLWRRGVRKGKITPS